jgi:prepilin-type N-terminal cleavage/methylation domain-containing protein/prepilin-type processing-associated H-X9-DG protein
MSYQNAGKRRGFTLVELLVVIGIIALLIAMLMPALTRARQHANSLKCKAQMRDIGFTLRMYGDEFRGVLFPIGEEYLNPKTNRIEWKTLGYEPSMPDLGRSRRWPVPAFRITDEYTNGTYDKTQPIQQVPVHNPEIMKCPTDVDPKEDHTYILNKYLAINTERSVKLGGRVRDKNGNGRSDSDVVLMGEKRISEPDYYMEADPASEFDRVVDPYKHGVKLGSNYLFLDSHVDVVPPKAILDGLDSWDPTGGAVNDPPPKP